MAFRLSEEAKKRFLERAMATMDLPAFNPRNQTTVHAGGQSITGVIDSVELSANAENVGGVSIPRCEATFKMKVSSFGDSPRGVFSQKQEDVTGILAEAREVSKMLADSENYGVAFIIEKLIEALESATGTQMPHTSGGPVRSPSVSDFVDRYIKDRVGPDVFRSMLADRSAVKNQEISGQTGRMSIQESSGGAWKDCGAVLVGPSLP